MLDVPERVHNPDVYPKGTPLPRDPLIEKLAWLMDGAIPIGRWSIGLDGLLGLVPGIGDFAGAAVSMLIVLRAVNAGVPKIAVARMVANVAIDSVIGAIPVAGDLFDFAYKSNLKNVRIYQEALTRGPAASARHWAFFALVALALLAIVALPLVLVFLLIRAR